MRVASAGLVYWVVRFFLLGTKARILGLTSPLQEGDWKAPKQNIREDQAGTSMLSSSGITHADLDTWPVTHAITVSGYSFSVSQTTPAAHQMADQQSPKNTTPSAVGSYEDLGYVSCHSSS